MKKYLLVPLILAAPFVSSAQSTIHPVQISTGVSFSTLAENKVDTEAYGYNIGVGYNVNPYVRFGLIYNDFDALGGVSNNLSMTSLEGNLLLPVSDYSSLYVGAGGAYSENDTNLTASLGVQYAFTDNWFADISYRAVFDMDLPQDDLCSFNARVVYRFSGPGAQNLPIIPQPRSSIEVEHPIKEVQQVAPTVKAPVDVVFAPQTVNTKPPRCKKISKNYRVQQGDYLLKLAQENNVSLEELIDLNKGFYTRNINLIYPGELIKTLHISCK